VGHKKRTFKSEPSSKDAPWWKRLYRWTGWRGKTLWDWQALLFVPVTIALIASLITLYQTVRQQDIENQRAQESQQLEALRAERAVVQDYLEHIGVLLLEKNLRTADEDSDVRLLARARTLAVLDAVSGDRKVRVLEFLFETQLIQASSPDNQPVISLRFADLRETRLVKRHILSGADLDRAELNEAKLTGANLSNANLPKADLSGAYLQGTDFSNANLRGADFSGAKGITEEELEQQTQYLEGATMPDGQKYED
jgi:hypothetical protein